MKPRFLEIILLAGLMAGSVAPAWADTNYCREFTKNIKVNGKLQEAYGTACLQPDGSWKQASDMMIKGQTVEALAPEEGFYPVGQSVQPAIISEPLYVAPHTVYRRTSFFFGSGYETDPYYVHGRYYDPYYWDAHWAHHRRYYRHDRHDNKDHHDGRHHGR